jgi:Holliday junction resolvase RusA-like endonuclease
VSAPALFEQLPAAPTMESLTLLAKCAELTPWIDMWIGGQPVGKGSFVPMINKWTHKAILVPSCKRSSEWQEVIRRGLDNNFDGIKAADKLTPVAACIDSYFTHPAGHFGKGGLLPSAPRYKLTTPDVDKLARVALDALTGKLLADDAQVVTCATGKFWSPENGVRVRVWVLTP